MLSQFDRSPVSKQGGSSSEDDASSLLKPQHRKQKADHKSVKIRVQLSRSVCAVHVVPFFIALIILGAVYQFLSITMSKIQDQKDPCAGLMPSQFEKTAILCTSLAVPEIASRPLLIHYVMPPPDTDIPFLSFLSILSISLFSNPQTIYWHSNYLPRGHWYDRLPFVIKTKIQVIPIPAFITSNLTAFDTGQPVASLPNWLMLYDCMP